MGTNITQKKSQSLKNIEETNQKYNYTDIQIFHKERNNKLKI